MGAGMTTGERIRQVRGRLVVGQAELARAAGLDQSGLWSIEHGRQPSAA
jgi:transcriptional regulator with XRE-family HTH domain